MSKRKGGVMTPKSSRAQAEAGIRRIVETWAEAVRRKESDGLGAHVAPDVVLFDLINPLQYRGEEALKKRAAQWIASFRGPIAYEMRDLRITAGEDAGFCHSLNHVSGTTVQGTKIDMWWRATVGFRKEGERWIVTHEHSSVPFDVEDGRVSRGLKP